MKIKDFEGGRWQRFVAAAGFGGGALWQLFRKRDLFLSRLTLPKITNIAQALIGYLLKRNVTNAVPGHLKVDVAPACQLKCPACPHGSTTLEDFKSPALMKFELFKKIVDDSAGRTIAMALYNLGEPLLHPRLPEMAEYADQKGINTYITTNLSLPLKADFVDRLVASGLKSLIVAVDGVSSETFGKQRIKGEWDLVSANLRLLQQSKLRQGRRFPKVVIQFIVFDFNAHERAAAAKFAQEVGASELHFIKGSVVPWLDSNAPRTSWQPKHERKLPLCAWPFFSAVIGSRGDVVACCHYRMADSYTGPRSVRSLGSVALQPLQEVYNSPSYQIARQMASSPEKAEDVRGHFCEGCGVITN